MQALKHLFEAFIRGGMRGWNPNDPLGYDPATKRRLHDDAEAHPVMRPLDAFNRMIGYPAMAAGDAGLRGVNALVHSGASAANQLMRELGLAGPHDNRLERDLVGMASMGLGSAGRIGGLAGLGGVAVTKGRQAATARRFVKGADKSIRLGAIGPQVEAASKGWYRQGPIRMRQGLPGPGGYGARHISPDKHRRARELGYADGLDLIKDVAKNHDVTVEQLNGRLMLVKRDGQNRYAIAEYREGEGWKRLIGRNDPYYGVVTGFPEYSRDTKPGRTNLERVLSKGGKSLWKKDP